MDLTEDHVRSVIAEQLPDMDASSIASDTNFADAGIDSLEHVSLLLALEEKHGLEVPDEDVYLCASIDAIVAYAADRA